MIISMIVGMGKNREIGFKNKLLWHIPNDLKNFKKVTMGRHLIMGRKTYESIGRPLPGRTTVIITRDKNYKAENCFVVHSLEEALEFAEQRGESEAFISGGEAIYSLGLNLVDQIYLTEVDFEGDADTFFPDHKKLSWEISSCEEFQEAGSVLNWSYKILKRKR